jgi:hypothetical protein
MAPCRINAPARMAESADAAASKAVVRKDVRVQVPLRARILSKITAGHMVANPCETTRSAVRGHNVVTTRDLEVGAACHEGRPHLPRHAARTLAALEDLSSRLSQQATTSTYRSPTASHSRYQFNQAKVRRIQTDHSRPRRSRSGPDNEVLKPARSTTTAITKIVQACKFHGRRDTGGSKICRSET